MIRRTLAGLLFLLASHTLASDADYGAFAAWARPRIVPLDETGAAFRSLDNAFKSTKLIGVGESVHESEPFLSFRVRWLKELIQRHQVTALVYESGLAEAMAADDYVTGRTSAVDWNAALSGGYGHLAGIRAAMEWLREWNLGAGRKRPVHVYGADVPGREASMLPALDRLQELTADQPEVKRLIDAVRPTATLTAAPWFRPAQEKYDALSTEAKTDWTRNVNALVEGIARLKAGDPEHLEWARRVAVTAQQYEAMQRLGAFSDAVPREEAMANNLMWILGRLKSGERAVYWAHNAHVQKVPVSGPALPPGRFASTGSKLKMLLGPKYFAIGLTYGGPSRDGGAAVPEGSLDAALSSLSTTAFVLRLDADSQPASVAAWWSEERPMRFQVKHLLLPVGPAFDALVYFPGARAAARAEP